MRHYALVREWEWEMVKYKLVDLLCVSSQVLRLKAAKSISHADGTYIVRYILFKL
jgi:hypothetical protein